MEDRMVEINEADRKNEKKKKKNEKKLGQPQRPLGQC